MKNKNETRVVFKKFKISVEVEKGKKMMSFRMDRGGEFVSTSFKDYCENEDMKRFLIAPFSPQQNGVVERRNRTVVEMVICMLKSKEMLAKFWGEAVNTAVYILNRSPTKGVADGTSYQAWFDKIPKVHHFKIFVCLAHANNTYSHLPKLVDRSVKTIMLGYEDGTKAYKLLNPQKNRIMVSRDVRFEEEKKWYWEEITNSDDEQRETFTIQISERKERNIEQIEVNLDERQRKNSSSTLSTSDSTSNASSSSLSNPKKFRSLEDIYREMNEAEEKAVGLCFLSIEKPTSYEEAAKNENGRNAMKFEILSIEKNRMWELANFFEKS